MSLREQVTRSIDYLNETELREVAEFLAFLKFRNRVHVSPIPDAAQLGALYGEFSDEDSCLAEQGMEDYIEGLTTENEQ
ncbi:hypothetical protein QUF72_04485 [Desulfobacterales bacterium HSG2]|nr:hypothetical protein [Desulfobacterales bacterium HSG2]